MDDRQPDAHLTLCCLRHVAPFRLDAWSMVGPDGNTYAMRSEVMACPGCGHAPEHLMAVWFCRHDCLDIIDSAPRKVFDEDAFIDEARCVADGIDETDWWAWIVAPIMPVHICLICKALRGRRGRVIARVGPMFGVIQPTAMNCEDT